VVLQRARAVKFNVRTASEIARIEGFRLRVNRDHRLNPDHAMILRFENVRGQVPLQLGDEQTVVHGVAGHLVTSLEYQHRPNKRAPQPAV
jgi:hypothetical protein